MAALRKTIWDEAFEEAAESFTYTMETQHPDWDRSYLGHLAAQIADWRAELLVEQPPIEGRPATPVLLVEEVQEVPALLPDDLLEQVIEGD